MRKYLGNYYHLPKREDAAASRGYYLVGTAGSSPTSTAASTEFARFRIPGELMVPGAMISLHYAADTDTGAEGLAISANGRNNTFVNLVTFVLNAAVTNYVDSIFITDFDAVANNVRGLHLAGTQIQIAASVAFVSDTWDLVIRNDTSATEARQLLFAQCAIISPALLGTNQRAGQTLT